MPPGRLGIAAAATVLVASATPALLAQAHARRNGAAQADALVAQLRDLPLPLRALPAAGMRGSSRPLPALEARRQHLYDELHSLGPASVAALARALRDPDPGMRRNAAVALDVIGGGWWHFPDGAARLDLRPVLPQLLAALQDPSPRVRAWAAQDVSDMGEAAAAAVPSLRAMLHRPDPESRGNACRALGRIGSAARGALPDLRGARDDPSQEVRQAARAAIARIERAEALGSPHDR